MQATTLNCVSWITLFLRYHWLMVDCSIGGCDKMAMPHVRKAGHLWTLLSSLTFCAFMISES